MNETEQQLEEFEGEGTSEEETEGVKYDGGPIPTAESVEEENDAA